jgi:hypothetical protein
MSTGRSLCLRCAAIALAQLCAPAYAQAQNLQHDVFARPALSSLQRLHPEPAPDSAPQPPKPAWNPVLRAVIVAGRGSLANVGGVIVGIGGIIDGYRLVQVRESEATFVKDGKRYTLKLGAIEDAGAARAAPAASTDQAPAAAPPAKSTNDAQAPATVQPAKGANDAHPPAAAPETQTTNDRQGLDTKRRSP